MDESFNDWGGRGYDDSVPEEVTKTAPSGDRTTLTPFMVGKLATISTHFTKGLVKYISGRGYFRAVYFQNGENFVTSPPPSIFERLGPHHYHPACGHKGSSHLSPVHALQYFYRDASSALFLQLVN